MTDSFQILKVRPLDAVMPSQRLAAVGTRITQKVSAWLSGSGLSRLALREPADPVPPHRLLVRIPFLLFYFFKMSRAPSLRLVFFSEWLQALRKGWMRGSLLVAIQLLALYGGGREARCLSPFDHWLYLEGRALDRLLQFGPIPSTDRTDAYV